MALIFRNNFTGGELSPEILMRPDLDVYKTGMAFCKNFVVKPQGGIESRPGAEHCHSFNGNVPVRLIPFIFSTSEAYILAFSTEDFTVFRNGEVELDSNGNEIVVPLPYSMTEAQVLAMDYAQSADVMTITIPGSDPIDIRRTGLQSWDSQVITFATTAAPPDFLEESFPTDPFGVVAHVYNLSNYTLTQDPNDPTVYNWEETYTFSFAGLAFQEFGKKFPNGPFQIYESDDILEKLEDGTIVDVESTAAGIPAHLKGRQEIAETENIDFTQSPDVQLVDDQSHSDIVFSGTTTDDSRQADDTYVEEWDASFNLPKVAGTGNGGGNNQKTYRYVMTAVYKSGEESVPSVVAKITTYSLSQTHGVKLSWSHDTPTKVEYYRVYKSSTGSSGSFGWIGDAPKQQFVDFNIAPITSDSPPERLVAPITPGCVTYYQQRQVFGNLVNAPLTFVSSKIASPFLFRQSRPIQDDDAFSITAATPEYNEIQYLVPLKSLLVLTTGSELRSTEGISEAFTASNTGIRRLSAEGCTRVKPMLAGSTLIYVQASGQRFRSVKVVPEGGYEGSDLTVLSRHLFEDVLVKQIAFSKDPHGTLWCVTADGQIRVLTFLESQKVTAWQRHSLAGHGGEEAKALSVASIPEGSEDPLYLLMERGSPGSYRHTMERVKYREGVYGLDSWARASSQTPVTTFSGFDHLAGQTVSVVADGYGVGEVSVDAGGSLSLSNPAQYVRAGYQYDSAVELPPITSSDIQRDAPKGVNECTVFVRDTRGIQAGVLKDSGHPPEMWPAYPASVGSAYPPPSGYTGQLKIDVGGPWSVDSRVRVEHQEPFKAEILAVETDVDV